jgi:anti-anti-sigma regulatory factor
MIVESYEDVIVLSGALRSNFWETIHTAISLTLKRHPTGVIIDCSGITECTPEGAATFVDAMEFIERHDARIIVAAVPPQVVDVLKSVPGVRSQLPIAASVEDARHSLDLLPHETQKAKKKPTTQGPVRKVIVCITGEPADDGVLQVATQIASPGPTEVLVVYPLIVPRDLPLQAPLIEQEDAAIAVLNQAKARLDRAEVPSDIRLERARDVASAIEGITESRPFDQVLVGLPSDASHIDAGLKLAKSVMTRVAVPVILVRGAGR